MTPIQEQPHPQWLNDGLATVPWVVIFLFLWFFIYRFLKKEKRRQQELDAAKAQAAALQQQLNEMNQRGGQANRNE